MKHLSPLLFMLSLAFAAVCSATPVAYSNISVTCKEFVPNISTETLTVTVDPAVNGGTITAGTQASNNCYFSLAGNALSAPFANGNYNYTSPLDAVCWKTGGFCVTGVSLVTLTISPVASGQLFTIVASSITTTFTLPAVSTPGPGPGPSPVPEPASLILLGSGLTAFGLVSRKRLGGS
jgi:hypothetical protein